MAEFRMPSLGADMETGRIVEWLIKPGDQIKRGDVVAVVETQKGTIDVESFTGGQVDRILVPVGEEVPVGAVLALIDGATPTVEPVVAPTTPAPVAPKTHPLAPAPEVPAAGTRLLASPAAKRLAGRLGVDLSRTTGTGPGGAIGIEDVKRAAQQPIPSVPTAAPLDAQAAMRAAIAQSMARSKREIPHYYLALDIDFKRALDWVESENRKRPVTARLLPAVLLLKAVALAIREVPEMNGFWSDGVFQPSDAVHLGVAISLPHGGLVAPALHDAEKQELDALMTGFRDLVTRARTGRLRSSEIADATITVTSLGEGSATTVFGVIYPPQVALVGFGSVIQRPWVVDGRVEPRPIITATLAADHRASVGHRGAQFLRAIDRLVQEPEKL